jgi:hypothetical protein
LLEDKGIGVLVGGLQAEVGVGADEVDFNVGSDAPAALVGAQQGLGAGQARELKGA